ncbi:hypothetical protein [Pedobacter sp. R20-19]|uniref:hypothetical protein n=1 Tax=Pedobacter sp. R20-19 TaxID=1270196 RepID=UPI000493942A|nr:hypothetical protein [Pedobacter sp. R20-19]
MEGLRNNLLKRILALALLCVLVLKVFSFSISYFSPSGDAFSIEKNAEENKDKEGEALDKNKKKLLIYESSVMDTGQLLLSNHFSLPTQPYYLRMGTHPPKSVPTPPPNHFSSNSIII